MKWNKKIFMSGQTFDKYPLDKTTVERLNDKYTRTANALIQSDSAEATQKNIQLIKNLKEDLLKDAEELDSDFYETINFLNAYLDTEVLHTAVKENSDVPKQFLTSLFGRGLENSILKIAQPFNFSQIKVLTQQIFKESKDDKTLTFSISKHEKIDGKVIGEVEQRKIKIPLAWTVKTVFKDIESYIPYIFGEKLPYKAKIVDEISGEFFLYRFLSKGGKEYTIASSEKLNLDDYTLEGISIEVEDTKIIGEAYKLLNKYTVFFIHTATTHICQFKTHQELFKKADELKITGNKLHNYLCSFKKDNTIQILEHPRWFVRLVSAFLFHKKKGDTAEYPMHLLWISERGSGKTTFMEGIQQRSGETQGIIAGSTSTMKYLIPSFKETRRPEMGALAKASRICVVDEFFRIIRITFQEHDDGCGKMNDLLEHKDRQAGSGHGMIRTSMTARLIAGTNPIAGTKEITNLVERFDDSFLSRFLIYYQTDEHVKLVHAQKKVPKAFMKDWIEVNDFLSIQDYLQSFDAIYDREKVIEIFDKYLPIFSEQILGIYEARYLHHLECLIDGVVKTRCLITRDSSFKATEEDYKEADLIWNTVIRGWYRQTLDDLLRNTNKSIESRLKILPQDALFMLHKLASMGYRAKLKEWGEKCKPEVQPARISFYMSLLKDGEFVKETPDGEIIHYAWEVEERK